MIVALADAPAELHAEVLIVGAGAAGLTLAWELGHAGVNVVVVESGDRQADEATQSLNEAETIGVPHNGVETGRVRALGGTTTVWPGQCMRLRPLDLDRWPLEPEELGGPYARAEAFLGTGPPREPAEVWRASRLGPPPATGGSLEPVASTYAQPADLGRRLRRELERSSRVRVVLGATALRLVLSENRTQVERVEIGDLAGRRASMVGRNVVVAAGGIENARLLLVSDIPNDCVGRYFHDHVVVAQAGHVATPGPGLLQDWFGLFLHGRRRAHVKLALVDAELPACTASFVFRAREDDPMSALLRLRRRALGREPLAGAAGDARRALASTALASAAYRRWARGLGPAVPPEAIDLLCIAEQPPDPESRITLAEQRDPLGVPQARLDWRVGDAERAAVRATVSAVSGWFESSSLGTVRPSASFDYFDGFHHMGATRMSRDPTAGVVDRDCRVHGVENLYVAGSSVFPSAGHANPTLTIVALALRLADRLRKQA